VAAGICALGLLAGCGGDTSTPPGSTPPEPQSKSPSSLSASATEDALPRIALPVQPGATVEGLVDVDGHDIYARCTGQGAPTVVYFTGWAPDLTKRGVDAIRPIESVDAGRHRICSYERRNTGRSETVDGTQSPEVVVADVDGVLDALGEHGPFVLLGASFGGLVSGAYEVAHPDRVVGVLLLDASIPDDYLIDKVHGFEGLCLPMNRDADANDSLEKVDNCRLAKWAYDRRDREPDVPLVYLAASDPSDRGDVADDKYRKAFVRGWSPGVWEAVTAPHYMDEADPELVEQNLEKVLDLAR
jgi:pimeloyl-ACP methyl ester carboxylesterase